MLLSVLRISKRGLHEVSNTTNNGRSENLIYIIGRCVSLDINNSALYKVVDMMWSLDYQRFDMQNYLGMVIKTHNPTPEIALQFLYKVLDGRSGRENTDIIKELCNVISKSALRIENIEHYITQGINDFNMLPLYSITSDKDKSKLIEYGKTSFKKCEFPYMLNLCMKLKLFRSQLRILNGDSIRVKVGTKAAMR